jgi:hypothetical protein
MNFGRDEPYLTRAIPNSVAAQYLPCPEKLAISLVFG